MNFKRYHVSRNLFIQKLTGVTIDSLGGVVSDANYDTYIAEVSDGETYTVCNVTGTQVFGFFTTKPTLGSITYNSSRTVFSTSSQTLTVPTGENIKYIGVRYNTGVSDAMLNTGSTPLPYEPYSSEVWHDIPHYIHNTSTDTITTLPADVYANDTTATVGLKGNMEQSGTPTPQNPIQPSECGERTENLFDANWLSNNTGISADGMPYPYNNRVASYTPIILTGNSVTLSFRGAVNAIYSLFDSNDTLMERTTNIASGAIINTTGAAKMYLCFYKKTDATTTDDVSNIMVVKGSTAPSTYIPYGYKIPISSASTTTPVYLGEVETTRKIKKLVLTGDEDTWKQSGAASNTFYVNVLDYLRQKVDITICSHYTSQANINGAAEMQNGKVAFYANAGQTGKYFYVRDDNFATLSDLKAWLAAQYAAGTPVTVWYVLATPETAVVNEPLMRIGDYADSLTTSIPCTAGENTLDVQTTVQPSEVTAGFSGWHPVQSVHERENGAWT